MARLAEQGCRPMVGGNQQDVRFFRGHGNDFVLGVIVRCTLVEKPIRFKEGKVERQLAVGVYAPL